jgi:ABC-2 type transport system ATP-binding protein
MDIIIVKNLTKRYGKLIAVDNINFTVHKGEIFSLLGPNGAGKTTTVEMMEGIRKATTGSISILGLDPIKDFAKLRGRCGILPQDFKFIDNSTPYDALSFYSQVLGSKKGVDYTDNIDDILRKVDLMDKKSTSFKNLSGGQKQKLGLALALINDPELLFLDEPTTGLDPQARRSIWDVIREIKKNGKTIILTTHYLDEAELLADRVGIVNKGKFITLDSPNNIVSANHIPDRLIIKGSERIYSSLTDAGYNVRSDDGMYEILMKNPTEVASVFDVLRNNNVTWNDFFMKRDSLEDVFVRLVGKVNEKGDVS